MIEYITIYNYENFIRGQLMRKPFIYIYKLLNKNKALLKIYSFVLFTICWASTTYAASTGLPWESPLEKILDSLTGPVAKILGVIAIVLAGFGIAFGEAGSGMRRIFQIVLGLSIAFTASSLVVSLFGFSGGALF